MYGHMHHFKIESAMIRGHFHRLTGYTEYCIGVGRFHFHCYSGVSSYTDHTHHFSGITGFPIKTKNGHVHKMKGALEPNNSHKHKFSGHTFEEISYSKGNETGEALV